MQKTKHKRLLSLLLTLAMVLSLLPMTALPVYAADRTDVTTVVATAENLVPVYNASITDPTFTVTEGDPAYFNVGMGYWKKKSGETWEPEPFC